MSEDAQEMTQPQPYLDTRRRSVEEQTMVNDKTNVIYETNDTRIKKNCKTRAWVFDQLGELK